jgi:hypothetical protein
MRRLRTSNDDIEVFRAQGSLKVLEAILALPEDIRSYLHDVAIGKRKKVEPTKETGHGMVRKFEG